MKLFGLKDKVVVVGGKLPLGTLGHIVGFRTGKTEKFIIVNVAGTPGIKEQVHEVSFEDIKLV